MHIFVAPMYSIVAATAVRTAKDVFLQTGFLIPIHDKKDSLFLAVINQTASGRKENSKTCDTDPIISFIMSFPFNGREFIFTPDLK